jgi:hypothetical protein
LNRPLPNWMIMMHHPLLLSCRNNCLFMKNLLFHVENTHTHVLIPHVIQ